MFRGLSIYKCTKLSANKDKRLWFRGKIVASHVTGPGSSPGRRRKKTTIFADDMLLFPTMHPDAILIMIMNDMA